MEITVARKEFTDNSTIGELSINGKFFCYTLEDKDRHLESGGTKVWGVTCIPRGIYNLILSFSNRFQKYLPEILNVPQFEGIRIHNGNVASSSEGCILLGNTKSKDFVGNSVVTLNKFLAEIKAVEKKEKVVIKIS
jgi:hypothetical protein